jgi:P4 family phage/plasmid primase-like protien
MINKYYFRVAGNKEELVVIKQELLSRLLNKKIGSKVSPSTIFSTSKGWLYAPCLANGLILPVDEKTLRGNGKTPTAVVKAVESNFRVNSVSHFFNAEDYAKYFIRINPIYYDQNNKNYYFWDYISFSYKRLDNDLFEKIIVDSLSKYKKSLSDDLDKAIKEENKENITYYKNMIQKINLGKQSVKNEIFFYIKIEALKKYEELERPEWYEIQCGSKLYNLKDGSDRPVNHNILVKNPILWEPIKGETPTIDKLFNDWSPKDKGLLLQMCAFAMVPKYFLKKVFWLLGNGNNGKSSFFDFLTFFIGERNIVTSDLSNLELNRFETSGLIDKLVCVVNEVDHKTLWNNRVIKSISGKDLVRVEEKNKPSYQVEVYSKIIILANDLPKRADYSEAFMSRFIGIIFPTPFEQGENPVYSIPPQEYCAFAYKCLFEVLMSSPKKKGLFESRSIQGEKPLDEKIIEYDSRSDPLSVFVDTFVEETENYLDFIGRQVFYSQYRDYCLKNNLKVETIKKCYSRLRNEFNFKEDRTKLAGENKPICFVFVKWKNVVEESLKTRVYQFISDRKKAKYTDLLDAFGEKVESVLNLMVTNGDLIEPLPGEYECL